MQNINRDKLKKIASIIEGYLPLLEMEENGKHNSSTVPLLYESGLNILLKKNSLKPLVDKRAKLKNAKIVRAAKNLIIQFEDFGINSYTSFIDKISNGITKLNGSSKLAPQKDAVLNLLDKRFKDYELECNAFYNTLLVDIFNQGRMHQTVTGKTVSLKKFASFQMQESQNFEIVALHLQNELFGVLDKLANDIVSELNKDYKEQLNKDALVKNLYQTLSNYSHQISDTFRKHCWQTYCFGNLYQLEKDGVNHVAWKTGHHIDDCISCRAFETGELILKDSNGQELPHERRIDSIIYSLNDISKVARLEGPSFFCHGDCRCMFVAAENNKSTF